MLGASTIRWTPAVGGRPGPLPYGRVLLASGELWSGIRVEEGVTMGAGALPGGNLLAHVVTLSVTPAQIDVHWQGERPRSGWCAPDTVSVFPASKPYLARWDRARRAIFTEISPQLLASAVGEGESTSCPELHPAFAEDDRFVRNVVFALRDLARDRDASDSLDGEMMGLALAAHLARRYGNAPAPPPRRGVLSTAQLRQIDEHIDARMETALSLRDLAAVSGMGIFRLARTFKQSTGVSPHQYLLRRRVDRAKSLLASGRSTLAEVALRCGFSSQSHLTDAFHRLVGITPGSYRDAIAGTRKISIAAARP